VAPAGLASLGELWERLRGGTYAAFEASRPAYAGFRDKEALKNWPGDQLAPLDDIRKASWGSGEVPEETINALAARMRSRRHLLAAVVFTPDEVLCRLRQARATGGKGLVDAWIGMCWTAEAAWRAVTADVPEHAAADAALLRPLAARLRFLVLSEPMRWRGEKEAAWWAWDPDQQFGGAGIVGRAFGPDSWRLLVSRCREARREWQGCLDAYQSHPLLSQAKPHELEQELAALIFRHAHASRFRRVGGPLGLPAPPVDQLAPLTAEDRAVIADMADRHLLPRFALLTVTGLGLFDDTRWLRWARTILAVAVAAIGAAAAGCAVALLVHPATILAAACYLLICAGVTVFPAEWGAMWLLRMPAASAVGIIALVGLLPGGWVGTPPRGWLAAGTLVAVSFGYLLIEARNHGVAPAAALARSVLVVAVGAVQALLVSLIALEVVTPAFAGDGGDGKALLAIWRQPGYGHAGLALALAAAWCLAVGVFSQILWDDRPITAPLAHLSWRR
jgi:hypothetical protein